MGNISLFRLGNYALFDGEVQRIETQTGVENSAFLDPLPITVDSVKQLEYITLKKISNCSIYSFHTFQDDAIEVIFNSKLECLIMEKKSQKEYPFVKWIHELQNLVEDKKTIEFSPIFVLKEIY